MGGLFAPMQQNPMMNINDLQMPLNQINPADLKNNPQALYAYNQLMAQNKIGKNTTGYNALSPQTRAWQQAILAKYFPNLRF